VKTSPAKRHISQRWEEEGKSVSVWTGFVYVLDSPPAQSETMGHALPSKSNLPFQKFNFFVGVRKL
jgi:hypothetical protein